MTTLTPSRLQFAGAIASLPTLFVAPSTPPEALALVQEILEEYYFDGIDDVVSAELNQNGDIVGEFTDRVGAREIKRYQYRIGDDVVEYVLVNPKATAKFSAIYKNPMFGPGSKKGKKKTCTKGTPCGDSCQQAGRKCSKKPGSAVKAKIVAAKAALGGGAKLPVGSHEYYLTDVSSISSSVPRNTFSEAQIQKRAKDIIDYDGLLTPLLLEKDGPINHRVISGHLDFYAAQEAKKQNPRKHEMVASFLFRKPEAAAEAKEQVKLLPKSPGNIKDLKGKEHEYYLVDVSSIKPPDSSKYTDKQINDLAGSADKLGGLVRPVLLKQTSPTTHEIVSGELEFLAAQRAREIDPRRGEMVSAFVYKNL